MSKLSIFTFALGAAVGSVVTWRVLKTKYERIAQEEIRDMGDYYKEKYAKEEIESDSEFDEYEEIAGEYSSDEDEEDETEITMKPAVDEPYLISIDEFGELYDYDRISLIYYKDDVLTDTTNDPVDEEELVGTEYKKHFGEIEGVDNAVYVRNDAKKVDYEVIKEDVRWVDVVGFEEEDE